MMSSEEFNLRDYINITSSAYDDLLVETDEAESDQEESQEQKDDSCCYKIKEELSESIKKIIGDLQSRNNLGETLNEQLVYQEALYECCTKLNGLVETLTNVDKEYN